MDWTTLLGSPIILMLIVALALFLGGVLQRAAARQRMRSTGITTTGRVVSLKQRTTLVGDTYLTSKIPEVEFIDPSLGARRFINPVALGTCPSVGATVAVWFDPADPHRSPEVRMAANPRNWVLVLLAGVLFLAVVAFITISRLLMHA